MDQNSARYKVLKYAERQFPEFLFFRAEDVFSQLEPTHDRDLLTLETNLLEYADCVMIILESAGAIAELGAFASSDEVAKRILLINGKEFQPSRSFIQLGPVAKVNTASEFRPTIYASIPHILLHGEEIKKGWIEFQIHEEFASSMLN